MDGGGLAAALTPAWARPKEALPHVTLGPLLFLLVTAVSTADPLTGEVIRYDLSNFQEVFYDSYYLVQIGYTLCLVAGITVVTLMLAVPLTLIIANLKKGPRSVWVVILLASLALSEVLTAFAHSSKLLYLPVPTINRDLKYLFAIFNLLSFINHHR